MASDTPTSPQSNATQRRTTSTISSNASSSNNNNNNSSAQHPSTSNDNLPTMTNTANTNNSSSSSLLFPLRLLLKLPAILTILLRVAIWPLIKILNILFAPKVNEGNGCSNKPCCGKTICGGCEQAHLNTMGLEKTCPFCRAPETRTVEETMALMRKRVELNDAELTFCLGCHYDIDINVNGDFPKDSKKAFELYLRAADLGSLRACTNVSGAYQKGVGTEIDIDKARFYLEKGAKLGQVKARHKLGWLASEGSTEAEADWELAFRHWKISARAAYQPSLLNIAEGYKKGMLSKEEYTEVLRASQKTKSETWSKDRETAARLHGWY